MKLCLLPVFGAAALFLSSAASAQPPTSSESAPTPATIDTPPSPGPSTTRWYGWQTLAVDGAVLAAGLLPLTVEDKSTNTALALGWYGGYSLGAPIVHWAHGHVGKGFGSLGMRLGGPLVGALMGVGIGLATGADFGANDADGNRLYVSTGDRLIYGGAVLG